MKISLEIVGKAYNGKIGCMCGCRGHYAEAETNPALVNRRVATIERMVKTGQYDECDVTDTYVYVSKGDRCFAVYYK